MLEKELDDLLGRLVRIALVRQVEPTGSGAHLGGAQRAVSFRQRPTSATVITQKSPPLRGS
jgi:hypothetical protein